MLQRFAPHTTGSVHLPSCSLAYAYTSVEKEQVCKNPQAREMRLSKHFSDTLVPMCPYSSHCGVILCVIKFYFNFFLRTIPVSVFGIDSLWFSGCHIQCSRSARDWLPHAVRGTDHTQCPGSARGRLPAGRHPTLCCLSIRNWVLRTNQLL